MSPKTTPNAASVNAGRQERLEWLSGSKERRKLLPHRTKCKLDYDGAQCARAQAEQLLPPAAGCRRTGADRQAVRARFFQTADVALEPAARRLERRRA